MVVGRENKGRKYQLRFFLLLVMLDLCLYTELNYTWTM